jgi:hypothetical protein
MRLAPTSDQRPLGCFTPGRLVRQYTWNKETIPETWAETSVLGGHDCPLLTVLSFADNRRMYMYLNVYMSVT